MKQVIKQIENYIQLHTLDMENGDYIELLREIAEWATNQANLAEFQCEELIPTEE